MGITDNQYFRKSVFGLELQHLSFKMMARHSSLSRTTGSGSWLAVPAILQFFPQMSVPCDLHSVSDFQRNNQLLWIISHLALKIKPIQWKLLLSHDSLIEAGRILYHWKLTKQKFYRQRIVVLPFNNLVWRDISCIELKHYLRNSCF